MNAKPHNLSVNRTACKLRLQAPFTLRAPAAGYLKCYAPEKMEEVTRGER